MLAVQPMMMLTPPDYRGYSHRRRQGHHPGLRRDLWRHRRRPRPPHRKAPQRGARPRFDEQHLRRHSAPAQSQCRPLQREGSACLAHAYRRTFNASPSRSTSLEASTPKHSIAHSSGILRLPPSRFVPLARLRARTVLTSPAAGRRPCIRWRHLWHSLGKLSCRQAQDHA